MANESWRRSVDDVVEAIRAANGRCVVLIGAGCSLSAGIPLAGGLNSEIKQKFPSAFDRAKAKNCHDNYNKLMRELTTEQRRSLLRGHINKARINWAHLALAQLFKHGKIDRALTVNFDPLLVRACALVGHYPAIYDLATASKFHSAAIAPESIFYLNGQHTGFSILNTENELEAHRQRLSEIVKDTGIRRTWVIVGYSGEADPLLEVIADHSNFDGGLYWVGHGADPSPELKRLLLEPINAQSKNVESKDAFYVGGQDADDFFLRLAQALDVFPPTIIDNPFSHVRELIQDIDFNTGGNYVKDRQEELLKKLDHCEQIVTNKTSGNDAGTDFAPDKLLLAGRYQEVLDWYQNLIAPSDADKNYAAWAYVLIGGKHDDNARGLADSDLPEARRLWALAGEKYAAALAIKPDKHEALYNWGNGLSAEARALIAIDMPEARRLWALAGEKYAAALAIKPDKHEALYNWGNGLSAEAQALIATDLPEARRLWALAGEKYAAALAINPDKHEALYNWGSALDDEAQALIVTDLPEARRLWALAGEKYAAALAINPDKHEALNNWGSALDDEAQALTATDIPEARRLWALAGEKYAAALAIKPDKHEALNNWGIALDDEACELIATDIPEARRLWAQAGEKYAAALAIKPDKYEALHNWGIALSAEARALIATDLQEARRLWALAGEKYAAALAIKPDMHEALNNWGISLNAEARELIATDLPEARRLWALAGEKYAAALAIKPNMHEALNNWVISLSAEAQALSDPQKKAALLAKARACCEQVEAVAPGEGAYNLACCYAVEGAVQECLHWLQVADANKQLPDRDHLINDRDLDTVREMAPFQAWWQVRFSEPAPPSPVTVL